MTKMAAAAEYKDVVLFLATAGVVVPIFHRLRVSPVLGFILVGMALGPQGLGQLVPTFPWLSWLTLGHAEGTAHLAEFGIVFLLFIMGIELSWERLRTLRRLVFGLGSLQVTASALVLGLAAWALGASALGAGILGLALALSSTAIVIPVLAAQKRLATPVGRATFSVLLFQDLAVAPALFAIAMLGQRAEGAVGTAFLLSLAQAAVALAVLVGVGRLVLRPLFHLVATTRSPELFMAASLLVIVGTAVIAQASGLSMALGAFIAGLLLAETEYRRAIEAMIDPFKGLLLGVFFVSLGMSIELARLLADPLPILAAAMALILVKSAITFALARYAMRLPRVVAVESALLLGPGGEFAFVIIAAATGAGLFREGIGEGALVVTTVSMLAIPGLARLASGFGRRLVRTDQVAADAMLPERPEPGIVIIAGFGRVGQLVAEMLERHKVPYLALDTDPALVGARRRPGKPIFFGDCSDPQILRGCGIETARALVVTLDSPRAVETVVAAARRERPDLTIVARARDGRHAKALYELGVDDAVPENFEASLQLSEAVLVDIGVPMGLVIASIHERRDEFRDTLRRKGERGMEDAQPFRGRRTSRKGS